MPRNRPIALTIAGSDSGGEAGIQADLKTFARLNVHGTSVITCLTAQNRRGVSRISPSSGAMVRAQLSAVAAGYKVAAAKTGMLYSAGIIEEVIRFFRQQRALPLVVDPVMISTSGRRLLRNDAVQVMLRGLLPLAVLVTPNLAEAEAILRRKIRTPEQCRAAARTIYEQFRCPALVKGGHLTATSSAADFYCGPEGEWMYASPRVKAKRLHGTGCTFSAAITAGLARGNSRLKAIAHGKTEITKIIAESF